MIYNDKSGNYSFSKFGKKIIKYINSTKAINEILDKDNHSYKILNSNSGKKTKKLYNMKKILKQDNNQQILTNNKKSNFIKSFSDNELLIPKYKNNNINKLNSRPFSSRLLPWKTININKNFGHNSRLTINNINTIQYNSNKFFGLRKNYSSKKRKRKKLKLKDDLLIDNIKFKSPIELLVEKKENEFNLKLSSKPPISNQRLLSNFVKKNFKYLRTNSFKDDYYYIKSKLNYITKSTENKICKEEGSLKFDDEKYKKFRKISKNIKKKLLSSENKLSVKNLLNKIKKEENVIKKERISQLKEDIEDNKILFTPYNFLRNKKDTFAYYKLNKLIQGLNDNFTYKNRFILGNKFNIALEDYIRK